MSREARRQSRLTEICRADWGEFNRYEKSGDLAPFHGKCRLRAAIVEVVSETSPFGRREVEG
jgi:hypothetical protein